MIGFGLQLSLAMGMICVDKVQEIKNHVTNILLLAIHRCYLVNLFVQFYQFIY